jgi:hypothetical protein
MIFFRCYCPAAILTVWSIACLGQAKKDFKVRLITLDPGHFHAALVQKSMYSGIDSIVYVYAPKGPDVQSHLDTITNVPPTQHIGRKMFTWGMIFWRKC